MRAERIGLGRDVRRTVVSKAHSKFFHMNSVRDTATCILVYEIRKLINFCGLIILSI